MRITTDINRGESFGGFELISSKTRNTDIVALNDTSIIVITKKGFGLLVKKFRDS